MKDNEEVNNVPVAEFYNSSFGEINAVKERQSSQLLGLSHSKVEQLLYELMFTETRKAKTKVGAYSIRQLMIKTGIYSCSSLRRAQIGLINKMSIERRKPVNSAKSSASIYIIYSPTEIRRRRRKAGFHPYPKEKSNSGTDSASAPVIERLVQQHNLSRRQAQVALKCAEGLSNAEISTELLIQQATVKFHLRNIFVKFGVKRRTELIGRLFQRELTVLTGKT